MQSKVPSQKQEKYINHLTTKTQEVTHKMQWKSAFGKIMIKIKNFNQKSEGETATKTIKKPVRTHIYKNNRQK